METYLKTGKTIIILLFYFTLVGEINAMNVTKSLLTSTACYPDRVQKMNDPGAPDIETDMTSSDLFSGTNPPVANFSYNPAITCMNIPVQMTDLSSNFPDSWSWSFSPSTVTYMNSTNCNSQNPQVQFNQNTNYSISLTASNSIGSSTTSKQITIGGTNTPYSKTFESGDFPGTWSIINTDYAITWAITSTGGNGINDKSAYMNFYNYYPPGQLDEMITDPIQLYGTLHPWLKFKVAYRQYSSGYTDGLKVYISTDCGTTWGSGPVYDKSGSDLATGPDQTNMFVPSDPSDWRLDSIDLTSYYLYSVKIKFQAVNGYGNDLYVNNISVDEQPVLIVQNEIVPNGQSSCYNAIQTINVAGNGTTFDVQDGGSATFIAGQKIHFLPGTSIRSGGYLHANITTDATYCGVQSPTMAATGVWDQEKENQGVAAAEPLFKVYPNPTTGTFTVELTRQEESTSTQVEMYGVMGEKIFAEKMTDGKKHLFRIEDKPAGCYFIRVTEGNHMEKKVIVKK